MLNDKKDFSKNIELFFGNFQNTVFLRIRGDAKPKFIIASTKGSEDISYSVRTPVEICCAFNRFCQLTIKREACNAYRDAKRRRSHEITFSNLTDLDENHLYTVDDYFSDDAAEKDDDSIWIACKKISPLLLAEALRILPEGKRTTILLYYYHGLNDAEIARLYDIPRSTVHYRRTSSLKLLKRYLEECGYDETTE